MSGEIRGLTRRSFLAGFGLAAGGLGLGVFEGEALAAPAEASRSPTGSMWPKSNYSMEKRAMRPRLRQAVASAQGTRSLPLKWASPQPKDVQW